MCSVGNLRKLIGHKKVHAIFVKRVRHKKENDSSLHAIVDLILSLFKMTFPVQRDDRVSSSTFHARSLDRHLGSIHALYRFAFITFLSTCVGLRACKVYMHAMKEISRASRNKSAPFYCWYQNYKLEIRLLKLGRFTFFYA